MDHRKITQLRNRARTAREDGEKAVVKPDELDEVLDLALAQIEEGQENGTDITDITTALDDELMGKFGHGWRRRALRAEKERAALIAALEHPAMDGIGESPLPFPDAVNARLNELVRAEQPRPLAAADITDEGIERALTEWHAMERQGYAITAWSMLRVLTAAVTPPPRPEWADAPAVWARTATAEPGAPRELWENRYMGRWRCAHGGALTDELRDVTPLYPREAES